MRKEIPLWDRQQTQICQTMSAEVVPLEILDLIFKELPDHSKAVAARTCKKWHKFIKIKRNSNKHRLGYKRAIGRACTFCNKGMIKRDGRLLLRCNGGHHYMS